MIWDLQLNLLLYVKRQTTETWRGLVLPSRALEAPPVPGWLHIKSTQSEKMVEARKGSEGGPEDEDTGLEAKHWPSGLEKALRGA